MLGTQLSASVISVMHTDGDADVDVVSTALTVANTCPVTLFGEDTDPNSSSFAIKSVTSPPRAFSPVHLYSNSSKMAVDIKKSRQ